MKTPKRMKKLVGYGLLIVIPVVLGFSYLFAELKMPDLLSIFLIVLISGGILFLYYMLFTFLEKRKLEKIKNKPDPFAD